MKALFKRLITSFDMTPSLRKSLKIYLIFLDLTPGNLSSKSFLYRFSILCPLSVVALKRIVEVSICQNMSKLSLINLTHKAGPNTEIYGPRSDYGFLRTG